MDRGGDQPVGGRAVGAGGTLGVRHTVEQTIAENGRVLGVTAKNHAGERVNVRAAVTIDASGFARHIRVRTEMGKAFHRYGYGAEYDMYAPAYPQDDLFLIIGTH